MAKHLSSFLALFAALCGASTANVPVTCKAVREAFVSGNCCANDTGTTALPYSTTYKHVTFVTVQAGFYNNATCMEGVGGALFWLGVSSGITQQTYFGIPMTVSVRGAGENLECPDPAPGVLAAMADFSFLHSVGFTMDEGTTLNTGQTQMNTTLNAIADGTYATDGVILVLETRLLVPAAKRVTAAGVPLILINKEKDMVEEVGAIGFVGADDVDQGVRAAEACVADGRASIAFVIEEGVGVTDTACLDREMGIRRVASGATKFAYDPTTAAASLEAYVSPHDCFVFCSVMHTNFHTALATSKADDTAVTIIGFDVNSFTTVADAEGVDTRWDYVIDQQAAVQADVAAKMLADLPLFYNGHSSFSYNTANIVRRTT
jgi:hypothetical protein